MLFFFFTLLGLDANLPTQPNKSPPINEEMSNRVIRKWKSRPSLDKLLRFLDMYLRHFLIVGFVFTTFLEVDIFLAFANLKKEISDLETNVLFLNSEKVKFPFFFAVSKISTVCYKTVKYQHFHVTIDK